MPPDKPCVSPLRDALGTAADDILVARAVDGDVDAFRVLLTRHAPLLRAYTARIVGSAIEADDVVQETFVIAWKQLPALRERARVKAWLMRIATRQAFRHLKRHPSDVVLKQDVTSPAQNDPEASAIRGAQLAALSTAIDALAPQQRRCWLLREVGELSYQDIAAVTGLTAAQVRGDLARARSSIATRMEQWR